jgi:hypothetical protein
MALAAGEREHAEQTQLDDLSTEVITATSRSPSSGSPSAESRAANPATNSTATGNSSKAKGR